MSEAGNRRAWIDVTRPLHNGMIQWPGDRPLVWQRLTEITGPGTCNISEIRTCLHVGTHIDAPVHFIPDGADIDQIPLERLCGPALVVEVRERRNVQADDLTEAQIEAGDGVLFKTANAELWSKPAFDEGFYAIAADAAEWLVRRGVRAVGVDYLSIDSFHSREKAAHYALLGAGIVVIEGLDLSAVEPGRYEMIALPLRIPGADGSPARVILRHI